MWSFIGQDRAVALLQHSLKAGRLAHAYLFVGPAHVGKMTLALDLAKALNCEANERPCGTCASCEKIASGKHADVQTLGLAASSEAKSRVEISIEQIRDLQHSASLPPFEGKSKVFIIDGAELLSTEAANCFLKTLEEPAPGVVFILLTTNDRLLPATVVSRCQRLELLPLGLAEVESALKERWHVETGKAGLLARLSRGCLGWAISAITDDTLLQQRRERLDEIVEIMGADHVQRFAYVARLAQEFSQNRSTVLDKLEMWSDWWRDLLLIKLGLTEMVTNIDCLATLVEMAKSCSVAQIRTFIENIQAAGEQLKLNANVRLALEVLMLSIPETRKHASPAV